ncbi:MAG: hypothetical protein JXA89_09765 [Anaerolineae bacterium]|nr:hypothetical protein [Anaerolineae bacterium]
MSVVENRLLRDYMDQLGQELEASPQETKQILYEVRSHIEMAVQNMQRAGQDETTCLAQVLKQFGTAHRIGQSLRQIHGRATWMEVALAVLPLILFGWLPYTISLPAWAILLALAIATAFGWRARWPLWWWAWLGWAPFVVPNAPSSLVWGAVSYVLILLLIRQRDWLEATLAIYPLPTAWAFHHVVLVSNEVQNVAWSPTTIAILGLGIASIWAALLIRTLRTPPGLVRISKALQGQGIIFGINALIIVAARLWPTYPFPYPFSLQHFVFLTIPYGIYSGLPFLLFMLLTSLPALLSLIKARARQQKPPSREVWNG